MYWLRYVQPTNVQYKGSAISRIRCAHSKIRLRIMHTGGGIIWVSWDGKYSRGFSTRWEVGARLHPGRLKGSGCTGPRLVNVLLFVPADMVNVIGRCRDLSQIEYNPPSQKAYSNSQNPRQCLPMPGREHWQPEESNRPPPQLATRHGPNLMVHHNAWRLFGRSLCWPANGRWPDRPAWHFDNSKAEAVLPMGSD